MRDVQGVFLFINIYWWEAAGDLTSKLTRRCLCAAVQALVCSIFFGPTV